MVLEFVRNDITKTEADAIVNAANTSLLRGGGVCGAIFKAAGEEKLTEACNKIGYCETGNAVITPGFNLKAKYIIHTPGPVWHGGLHKEEKLLRSCYLNSLKLADEYGCRTVAFPLISSGIYGYPPQKALKVAEEVISSYEPQNEMKAYLVFFDSKTFNSASKTHHDIKSYIDDYYAENEIIMRPTAQMSRLNIESECCPNKGVKSLEDAVENMDKTFSQTLFELIDSKNLKDSEVYKRANIDRKLFSKIRSNENYKPSKNTALALAIALRLNLDQTRDFIMKAGFALSHSSKFDVIIEYFIKNKKYDIMEINEALFDFGQSLLGA